MGTSLNQKSSKQSENLCIVIISCAFQISVTVVYMNLLCNL